MCCIQLSYSFLQVGVGALEGRDSGSFDYHFIFPSSLTKGTLLPPALHQHKCFWFKRKKTWLDLDKHLSLFFPPAPVLQLLSSSYANVVYLTNCGIFCVHTCMHVSVSMCEFDSHFSAGLFLLRGKLRLLIHITLSQCCGNIKGKENWVFICVFVPDNTSPSQPAIH